MRTKYCYKIGEVWYFRKKLPESKTDKKLVYRISLKKLLGNSFYHNLLSRGFLYNLVDYLNFYIDDFLSKNKRVTVAELNDFVKSLLRRYREKATIVETEETDFLDNIGSDTSDIETQRFNALGFYDDSGSAIGGHTPSALQREINSVREAYDSSKMSNISVAAQRILQRQDIMSSEEIEKIPENLLKPFFEALLKIEIGVLEQDVKNYEHNTAVQIERVSAINKESIVNGILKQLAEQEQTEETKLLRKIYAGEIKTTVEIVENYDMLIEDYLDLKKAEGRKPNTIRTLSIDLKMFKELMQGDLNLGILPIPLLEATLQDVLQVKTWIKILPDMRQEKIKYIKNRGIHYLMQLDDIERIGYGGMKSKTKSINGFLSFLKNTNPIYKELNLGLWAKIAIEQKSLTSDQQKNFKRDKKLALYSEDLSAYLMDKYNDKDTQKIKNFKVHTGRSSHVFFGAVLSIFTGARAEEIAQLKVSDFKKVVSNDTVIYAIMIQVTDTKNQSLKNENSTRTVPLHPSIIKLGFLNYLKKRIDNKEEWLFDLSLNVDGKRKHFQKNWNTTFKEWFKKNHPELVGRAPTFHSLRDHFITKFYQHVENDSKYSAANLKKLTGHGKRDVTIDSYYKEDIEIALAYDIVSGIDFKIDPALEHLEKLVKKYVGEPLVDIKL